MSKPYTAEEIAAIRERVDRCMKARKHKHGADTVADSRWLATLDAAQAQPAPVAEAVVWDDLNMCDEETLRSCVDIIDRVPTDNGGISPTLGAVARTALYYLKRASATPRAEAASAEAVREALDRLDEAAVVATDLLTELREWDRSRAEPFTSTPGDERFHKDRCAKANEAINDLKSAVAALRSLPLPSAPASAEAVAVEAFRQGWARCLAANSDRFVHGCKALLPTQDDEDRAVAHALRAGKGAT